MKKTPFLTLEQDEVTQMGIFDSYQKRFEQRQQEEYSLQEYLQLCKDDGKDSDIRDQGFSSI